MGREKREVNERERVVFGSKCLGVEGNVDVGKQISQAWHLVRRVQGLKGVCSNGQRAEGMRFSEEIRCEKGVLGICRVFRESLVSTAIGYRKHRIPSDLRS